MNARGHYAKQARLGVESPTDQRALLAQIESLKGEFSRAREAREATQRSPAPQDPLPAKPKELWEQALIAVAAVAAVGLGVYSLKTMSDLAKAKKRP